MPRAKRQPLKVVKNEAQVKAESPTKPAVSAALKKAIDTMDHTRLRLLVKNYCETMEPVREDLEKSLLVPGGEVVRYHVDTESEDDKDGEKEGSSEDEIKDEDASDIEKAPKERKERKPIAVADDEMVPRYTICLRCKAEFDVTANDKGDCKWHSGFCFLPLFFEVLQRTDTILKARKRSTTMMASGMTMTKIATGTSMTLWTTQTSKTVSNGLAVENLGMLKVAS